MAAYQQRMAFYLRLSRRQREVVWCVARCMDNTQIAHALCIVPGAVANHLTKIYRLFQEAGYCPEGKHYKRSDLVGFFGDFFSEYPELVDWD
ncbi:MAG: helix-turn-helix transcriptional regulator [Anaerolineae bacterium]|nr:helix-turn-helix transcriptional regulator [Anaerolineae bacterium]